MAAIPKNVMQIGQTDPHVKIYMEDYVHTFLERCEGSSVCLAFGRKEESEGICYYLIYGAEKKQDWDRGSFPYFKKLERIGEIAAKNGEISFKTVQGREIPVQGYFIFYEQNEDMQSYMIAERESREAEAQRERERVMEEVQIRREKRKQEAEQERPAGAEKEKREMAAIGRALRARYLRANAAVSRRIPRKKAAKGRVTLTGVCRAGCLALLMILAATALTSLNRYPDMKAVTEIFSDAADHFRENGETLLVVEETSSGKAFLGGADSAGTGEAGAGDIPVQTDGEAQWLIGRESGTETEACSETQTASAEQSAAEAQTVSEEQSAAETQPALKEQSAAEAQPVLKEQGAAETQPVLEEQTAPEETAAMAGQTETLGKYTVQKGDSLAKIARRFYGSTAYVGKICDLNQIEDPDRITPGQNILLP